VPTDEGDGGVKGSNRTRGINIAIDEQIPDVASKEKPDLPEPLAWNHARNANFGDWLFDIRIFDVFAFSKHIVQLRSHSAGIIA
jgi:hypothetical protein